jgi:hypothetical protein
LKPQNDEFVIYLKNEKLWFKIIFLEPHKKPTITDYILTSQKRKKEYRLYTIIILHVDASDPRSPSAEQIHVWED